MNRPPARDSGLQPERTLLAWQRTLFGLAVVTLLYLRVPAEDAPGGLTGQLAVVAVLFGVCAVLLVHLRRRWRRSAGDRARGAPPAPLARPWTLVLLSVTVMGLAAAIALSALPR